MDNNDAFELYFKDVFSSDNVKDSTVDIASQSQTIIQQFFDFLYNGSPVTQSYHYEIMKQAQLLLTVFSALFTLSTIFVLVCIGVLLFGSDEHATNLIPLFVGGIVDLFAGILIVVIRDLLKSRDYYFCESLKSEHFSKIIGLISTVKDEEKAFILVEKIIANFCEKN